MKQHELDELDVRAIANELGRDVRTVRKVIAGGDVRGIAGAQIRRAIEQRRAARISASPNAA